MNSCSKFTSFIFLCLLYAACAGQISTSHLQSVNKESMLIGEVDKNELFKEFAVFQESHTASIPSDSALKMLHAVKRDINIEIVFGSWCSDSKRNLPAFLKLIDQSNNPHITYRMIAVDRTKKDKAGVTTQLSVTRVPTMVFFENHKEIGRFTEHPVQSIEEDILRILNPSKE